MLFEFKYKYLILEKNKQTKKKKKKKKNRKKKKRKKVYQIYMDTGSNFTTIITDGIYRDIGGDVKKWFDRIFWL